MNKKENLGEFTCDFCGGIFNRQKTMEQAIKEYENSSFFNPRIDPKDLGMICDDCLPQVKAYFEALTELKKKKMTDEYLRSKEVNG